MMSPYVAMNNDPVLNVDPTGLQSYMSTPGNEAAAASVMEYYSAIAQASQTQTMGGDPLINARKTWGSGNAMVDMFFTGVEAQAFWAQISGQKFKVPQGEVATNFGAQNGFTKDQVLDAGYILDGEDDKYYYSHEWTEGNNYNLTRQGIKLAKAEGGIDLNKANNYLDYAGGIFGALEKNMKPNNNQWLGTNGSYYSMSWGGNQYTGARSTALNIAARYKWAGRATVLLTVGVGALQTYDGYKKDGGKFGYNANSAIAKTTGSVVGGWAGAEIGAAIGAGVGGLFFGVGAIPGTIIGGIIGGLIGGNVGGDIGESAVDTYYSH